MKYLQFYNIASKFGGLLFYVLFSIVSFLVVFDSSSPPFVVLVLIIIWVFMTAGLVMKFIKG